MSLFPVTIKHSGKTYSLTLDASQPPRVFKDAIYQSTGVLPERMKVMVKGGTLKDDDWGKLVIKDGMSFMVIGAAGDLPKPPEKKIVFLEDMDDQELASALSIPVGLENLGNTCYMNATLQAIRSIPELQTSLANSPSDGLPQHLSQLYGTMSTTTESCQPFVFLSSLRQNFPQFAEMSRHTGGMMKNMMMYAQQDAEECYSQILGALKEIPDVAAPGKKFVETWMMGRMRRELRCDEAPEEPPSVTTENVLKIECNINAQTNFMESGIMASLDQKVSKRSLTLNREATYSQRSRLERLPAYLTVHMVRFAWKRDIGKKAKIMRKVKFPTEFNAIDLVTDELKSKILPLQERLNDIEKLRFERRKIGRDSQSTTEKALVDVVVGSDREADHAVSDVFKETVAEIVRQQGLSDESEYRANELTELEGLVHPDLKGDVGSNPTGMYELIAIITHKGAAADGGHYIGFVKKSVFHPRKHEAGKDDKKAVLKEGDEDWYKFDDDKVSEFPAEKLPTLDGGGEDSSAYVLLYRSKPLA